MGESMSATRLPWFRMYTDFLNDPKLISLAFEDQRHFIGVLALKSDGAIDDVCEETLLDRIVAQRLWIDHGVIREVKKRLIAAMLIDSSWQPVAWEKRQRPSDKDGTAAERQRRARLAKSQNQANENQSRVTNRDSHASVTRLDIDIDIDIDKEVKTKEARATRFDAQAHLVSIGVDTQVSSDWLQHRKAKKASVTKTVIDGIIREAEKAGIDLNDALAMCCQRGWIGFKAEWVAEQSNQPSGYTPGFAERRDAETKNTLAILTGRSPTVSLIERDITAEVRHVA